MILYVAPAFDLQKLMTSGGRNLETLIMGLNPYFYKIHVVNALLQRILLDQYQSRYNLPYP